MHCFFYILLPHFSVRTYNLVINDTIICPYFKNIKWRSLTIYSFAQVRHKTKHKKFMLGLPAEVILHILIIAAAVYFSLS